MVFAVEVRNLYKVYSNGVVALRGVSLGLEEGMIHAVLGENGAGKTTLMRIIYGELRPTRGEVLLWGRLWKFRGPWEAVKAGIYMVHQRFSLVGSLTVLENIALSQAVLGMRSLAGVEKRTREAMKSLGFRVSMASRAEDLSSGERQRVEILKAVMANARILILDEPTSVIGPHEARELFKILRRLRSEGRTVVLITHKLREALEVADTITVMRKGRMVSKVRPGEVGEEELASMMVGPEALKAEGGSPDVRRASGDVKVLEVEDLHVQGDAGTLALKGVSFHVREGEIFGIAGVQGSGQKELVEAIAGLRRPVRGRILVGGLEVTGKPPSEIYRMGVSYIPDARERGLVMDMSILENTLLTRLSNFSRRGLILWRLAREDAERIVRSFGIVARDLDQRVSSLSGGNQQRLLLGRELSRSPRLVVAHEPTQGLDVAATRYVRSLISAIKDRGCAVLLVSSDLEEILELSDRVGVLYEGRLAGVEEAGSLDPVRLGLLMGGGVEG